jgi:hypothetical protein
VHDKPENEAKITEGGERRCPEDRDPPIGLNRPVLWGTARCRSREVPGMLRRAYLLGHRNDG